MNWFTSLFSSGASVVIDSVGKAIDSLVTSDEERIKLKNELEQSMNSFSLQMEAKSIEFEQEITKRWQSDNEHIITRLTRPAIVIWGFVLLTVVMLADGNIGDFKINSAYIPLLETIVTTSVFAYMGSRGLEKSVKHFKKEKQ